MNTKLDRTPVLTLWAAVVAERMGFDHYEALTLGWAVAGLGSPNRDTWLATFQPTASELRELRHSSSTDNPDIKASHSAIPIMATPDGVRALENGKLIRPDVVATFLVKAFGEHLETVESAMTELAQGYSPEELAVVGYSLHEKFFSDVPADSGDWSARSPLDLAAIRKRATGEK